jgi:hypothetical protein
MQARKDPLTAMKELGRPSKVSYRITFICICAQKQGMGRNIF